MTDEQAAREYAESIWGPAPTFERERKAMMRAHMAGAQHGRKAALADLDRRIWAAIDPSAEGVARQCAEIARRVINEMLAELGG